MLRRVKKDVENEIGTKYEVQINCEMSELQVRLYKHLKKRLSINKFFSMLESKTKVENLMNLVMQLRKVCNHPELFQRRQANQPFLFNSQICLNEIPVGPRGRKIVKTNRTNPIKLSFSKVILKDISY